MKKFISAALALFFLTGCIVSFEPLVTRSNEFTGLPDTFTIEFLPQEGTQGWFDGQPLKSHHGNAGYWVERYGGYYRTRTIMPTYTKPTRTASKNYFRFYEVDAGVWVVMQKTQVFELRSGELQEVNRTDIPNYKYALIFAPEGGEPFRLYEPTGKGLNLYFEETIGKASDNPFEGLSQGQIAKLREHATENSDYLFPRDEYRVSSLADVILLAQFAWSKRRKGSLYPFKIIEGHVPLGSKRGREWNP